MCINIEFPQNSKFWEPCLQICHLNFSFNKVIVFRVH
uniref:Uncharacterized protein n=1 Tax=Rhizophora mucronata TaxID=61149 RepID=A0A2P2NWI8_RHIMU